MDKLSNRENINVRDGTYVNYVVANLTNSYKSISGSANVAY